MAIYLICFLLSVVLIWVAQTKIKSKKIKIALMVLAILPFFVVSAIRYDLGTDYTKRYTKDFLNIAEGKDIKNLEIGFKLIDYFCLIFTKQPYMLFIITSLLILAGIFLCIFKKSENIILSIVIFFLGAYFFGSLNLVRQYIAISLLFVGYIFLNSENKKKAYIGYITCAILAFFMHSTSIVSFILIFLNKKMIVNAKWVLPLSVLILILNENIMNVFGIILAKTRFKVYLDEAHSGGEISILNILENAIIYIWMYAIYLYRKKKNENILNEEILLINIQAIAFTLTTLACAHHLFSRIALYFTVFQIISVPYYIKLIPYKEIIETINTKFKKQIEEKTLKIATYTAIILCFSIMFSYTNILHNDNEVLPYKTIFTK